MDDEPTRPVRVPLLRPAILNDSVSVRIDDKKGGSRPTPSTKIPPGSR